jgi:diaminopimelate epimerase
LRTRRKKTPTTRRAAEEGRNPCFLGARGRFAAKAFAIIRGMKLRFTKMQGAGNDFVVLDATRTPLALDAAAMRRLADRRFGVGADQILVVEPGDAAAGIDFGYRIFNGGSGEEVEQCGNGARCFVRYVLDKGLADKSRLLVRTVERVLELRAAADGRVTVDMGAPVFDLARVPFDASGLAPRELQAGALWPIDLEGRTVEAAVLSMGNPHAVIDIAQFGVGAIADAPVASIGPRIETHRRFARGVNAGFAAFLSRERIALRVHERGAGETLACGSGACAAVVAGIRCGRLDSKVDVLTRGGVLSIEWRGGDANVFMTGPAQAVFEGEIEL